MKFFVNLPTPATTKIADLMLFNPILLLTLLMWGFFMFLEGRGLIQPQPSRSPRIAIERQF